MAGPIVDPYAGLDWGVVVRKRGVTHQHIAEQAKLDLALAAGCEVFASSNYYPEEPTPRDRYAGVPAGMVWLPNSEQHSHADIDFHFCPVGSTISNNGGTAVPWRDAFDESLTLLVQADGGGIFINHPQGPPVALSLTRLFEMMDYDPRVLGIEVYNHTVLMSGGYRQSEADQMLLRWDDILASGRRCWGSWVHDHYADPATSPASYPYRGFNVLLLPEVTEAAVLSAYRQGHWYGARNGSGLVLQDVAVADHTVTITTDSATTITMVCDYVRTTLAGPQAVFTVPADAVYVRFEAENASDTVYTQPLTFRVPATPVLSPRAKAAARRRRQAAALRRR